MSEFTDTLIDGYNALFVVDGQNGTFTPLGGAEAPCRVILTEQTEDVDVGDDVRTYLWEAKVLNSEIPPNTAQGGVLKVGSKSLFVVRVTQENRVISILTLSTTPLHGMP